MSGARTVSAPKLKRTLFSFSGRQTLQGEKQTLKVESTQTEALQETNRILVEIQNQLALDFANRIAERKEAISGIKRQTQKERASRKEQSVEALSKFGQGITKTFDKVTAPVKNIFSKLLEFFGIITTGILVNTAFDWLSNEENRKKLSDTLDFVGKYWKEILGGIIAIKLIGTIKSLIGAFRLASLVLRHPAFLTAAGAIVLAAGAISLGNYLREQKEKRQREYVEAITGTNYETSVSGKPAQIVPTLPPGRGYGRDKESVFDLIKEGFGFFGGMSTGGTVKKYNFNPLVRLSQGGSVGGRGSGAVDTVPAMLAPGEEVIRSSAANPFRPLLKDINDNAGRLWKQFTEATINQEKINAVTRRSNRVFKDLITEFTELFDEEKREISKKNRKERAKTNPPSGDPPSGGGSPGLKSKITRPKRSRPKKMSGPSIPAPKFVSQNKQSPSRSHFSSVNNSIRQPVTNNIAKPVTNVKNIVQSPTSTTVVPFVIEKETGSPSVNVVNLAPKVLDLSKKSTPKPRTTQSDATSPIPSISPFDSNNDFNYTVPETLGILV